MPKLENAKHDDFARLLAQGRKQHDAYMMAGYAENKGAASRLANSPQVQDRVAELKKEIDQKINTAMAVVSEENWLSLAEMGLNIEWVAKQYKVVYEASLNAGSFAAANAAVSSIQKLIELERNGTDADAPKDEDKIDVTSMLKILDKVSDIMKRPVEVPLMRDITPKEIE